MADSNTYYKWQCIIIQPKTNEFVLAQVLGVSRDKTKVARYTYAGKIHKGHPRHCWPAPSEVNSGTALDAWEARNNKPFSSLDEAYAWLYQYKQAPSAGDIVVNGYLCRDFACPKRQCWNPGRYAHMAFGAAGRQTTGMTTACCLTRAYHGCPQSIHEIDVGVV